MANSKIVIFVSVVAVGIAVSETAIIVSGSVKPRPRCSDVECPEGTYCKMWTRPCSVPPCPTFPACLPGVARPQPDCTNVECGEGESCEMWSAPTCRSGDSCPKFPVCLRVTPPKSIGKDE